MRRIAVVLVALGCAPAKPPVVPEAALAGQGSPGSGGANAAIITPGMTLTLSMAAKTATVHARQPCPRNVEPVPSGNGRRGGGAPPSGAHPLWLIPTVIDAAVNTAILGKAVVDGVRAPDPVQRARGCSMPAVRLWVTLELPAGVVLHGRTNEAGEVTFAIPGSVPAGPAVAHATPIRSAVIMYDGPDE